MRAALDWSWDLLEEPERRLLSWLAVFAGGWTLAAAEAVLAATETAAARSVLDGLDSLVNKSLVQVDETGAGAGRYRLLETVRAYAGARLASSGDAAMARDRHLAWCLALAEEEAAPQLTGPAQGEWLALLETEHENVRAALRWAHQERKGAQALRLAAALWRFWYLRGYLREGRTWLEAALSLTGVGTHAAEARTRGIAYHGAGVLAWAMGDYAQAVALAEQALARWRALGDQGGMAPTLNLIGLLASDQGAWGQATAALEESLALHRANEHRWGIATTLHNLGTVARQQGDADRAAALYDESLALRRSLGDEAGIAISYKDRGMLAAEQGDTAQAVACFRAGLTHAAGLGDAVRMAECLEGLAMVTAQQGRATLATQVLGAAAALREQVHAPIAPAEHAARERLVATLQAAMRTAFNEAWAAGRAVPWDRLVSSIVDGTEPMCPAPAPQGPELSAPGGTDAPPASAGLSHCSP